MIKSPDYTESAQVGSSQYGRGIVGSIETTLPTLARLVTVSTSPLKRTNFESAQTFSTPTLPFSSTTSSTKELLFEDISVSTKERIRSSAEDDVSHRTSAPPRPIERKSAENASLDPSSLSSERTFIPRNKTSDAVPAGTPLPVKSSRSDRRKVRGRGTPARAEGREGLEAQTTMSPPKRFTAPRAATLDRLNPEECESLCKPKYRTVCAQVGNITRTFNSLCDVKIESCITGDSKSSFYW